MKTISLFRTAAAVTTLFAAVSIATPSAANPFEMFNFGPRESYTPSESYAYAPVEHEQSTESQTEARFRRQVVYYRTNEAPGTIIIDTPNTYLYFVLGNGRAIRYGIGVGRDGFTWSGVQHVTKKAEWPSWTPPAEMIARQPYLPRFMAGGPGNPLGARAMYLGNTIYRIHGTNAPSTIGGRVSSGCIRLVNEDVVDLYGRVNVGTKVVVMPGHPRSAAVR